MKKSILFLIVALTLVGCQKSLEERAELEAKEYTKKYCPTPIVNYSRTDSMVFDKANRTYIYYCTLTDMMDDKEVIESKKDVLSDGLLEAIKGSTYLKAYKDAGFGFRYIIRSEKDPSVVLFDGTYTKKDYQ